MTDARDAAAAQEAVADHRLDIAIRWILGLPLFIVAGGLLFFASKLGANGGELAAVPALVYLAVGLGVVASGSKAWKIIAGLLLAITVRLLTTGTMPTK